MTKKRSRVDPELKRWASEHQAKCIDAVNDNGSLRKAAKALGVNYNTVHSAVERAERNAAVHGYSPHHDLSKPVPDTHFLKGASTLYGKDGEIKLQWIKSAIDEKKLAELKLAIVEAMAAEVPRAERAPMPEHARLFYDHLLTVYTLTDCHVGMYAWGKETGGDWDLDIAEKTLVGCFGEMIDAAPAAAIGFVNQLGDFLHQDGLLAITPLHGHNLDSDSRFGKIVRTAIRIIRAVVDMALAKHELVILLLAEGNHDIVSSIWLRALFSALYENEPRVQVIESELPYYVHQHGQTMLAFHHGHLSKNDRLPLLMAAQFPQVWGSTTKRYVHTGHRHHVEEKEHQGITVVQHPTLAARDAYAARGGWIAERQVTAITYHATHGRVRTDTVVPEMLA